MNQTLIFLPLIAQVLLTAVVFFHMYHTRVTEMKKKSIHPQKIATSSGTIQYLVDSRKVADNFSNQFEMPVLFYLLSICLYITELTNILILIMASIFVFFRIIHSWIHCTYNKVLHRLYAYAASSFVLWAMWAVFSFQLINNL